MCTTARPSKKNHLYNICTASAQGLRCWSNIVQIVYKCFVFTGVGGSQRQATSIKRHCCGAFYPRLTPLRSIAVGQRKGTCGMMVSLRCLSEKSLWQYNPLLLNTCAIAGQRCECDLD